ncbi:hydrolase [Streptomyces yokosukanensis]|uniref:Hydrolase n=1 Tax=Streptomyces yokosukanensis TaxID=67386 RepID=A0A101NXD9_9ACTN|nr:acyl-CoA dehydrogenase family protein [Streptomyces yokosukanensis]KUN01080.1 hydrolase [Streptomyces yokosukanensis]
MLSDSTATILAERPGVAEVVAAAPRVAQIAARCSDETEAARRLAPEVVEAVREAGFARHFVPAAFGGKEGGFLDMTKAVALVGEGCASAAWAASLSGHAARYGAYLPLEGQAVLWGDGPDALMAGALMPAGTAEPVSGGWRLSGEWKYISGVRFADWVFACSAVPGKVGPDGRGEVRFFAVPQADITVKDTWFTLGMRGTGSDTMVLDDVFVPEHLTLSRFDLNAGRATASEARCHTVPVSAVNALPLTVPVVGAARGTLLVAADQNTRRVDRRGAPLREKLSVQVDLARSAAEVDAAELLVQRAARVADGVEGTTDGEAAVRGPRDFAMAVELSVSAVERVFRGTGTTGHFEFDPVQRFWRDVNTAASHVIFSFEPVGAAYGAWALGVEGAGEPRR